MIKIKQPCPTLPQRAHMRGFTLVEMLISSAISLILIAGVLSIAMSVMGSSAEKLKRNHLTQELRDTVSVMVRDIRRAGFNAGGINVMFNNNSFTQGDNLLTVHNITGGGVVTATTGNCITYAYDYRDHPNGTNGVLDDVAAGIDERRGFRLKNAKVQIYNGTNAPGAVDCAGAGWQSLTSDAISITKLEFISSEECNNVSLPNFPTVNCSLVDPNISPGNIILKQVIIKINLTGKTVISGSAATNNLKTVTRTITDSAKIRNAQTTLIP